ncbi:MAG: hypothetical protein HON53_07565 [Planctomycetaceae bacterium]|nr:hypothetical protein [Planctomycetaceae bacterium]MBT6153624.1 hypothetical protein [Planctomycetaceae bacterium]MBT6484325.1 hypothetical protein [Planctomycetaceae bacterium]
MNDSDDAHGTPPVLQGAASSCRSVQLSKVGDEGLEQPATSPQKTAISDTGGAESGAVDARNGLNDPALVSLIEAWPTLPQAVRDEIAALVDNHVSQGK